MPPKRREYLHRYVENPHTPTAATLGACWDYTGAKNRDGYGTIRTPEGVVNAHRVFYERCEGPIPDGLDLDHLCHRRICVRPSHLEPVTRKVNTQRGIRAALTPTQIQEIRNAATEGCRPSTVKLLAGIYRVTPQTIRRVLKGETWANVA